MSNRNIISIGKDCGVAIALRNLGIRTVAYPWDWARHTTVCDIIDIVENKETFNVSEWKNLSDIPTYLPHDKPGDTHGLLENRFENVTLQEKYTRRFERFFKHIYKPNTYIVRFGPKTDIPDLDKLSKLLPNITVVFIEDGSDADQRTYDILKSVFQEKKEPIFVFLETMLKIYDNTAICYPCQLSTILFEMKSLLIQEEYIQYVADYKPSAIFQDKFELIHYVYKALQEKGYEYCIM